MCNYVITNPTNFIKPNTNQFVPPFIKKMYFHYIHISKNPEVNIYKKSELVALDNFNKFRDFYNKDPRYSPWEPTFCRKIMKDQNAIYEMGFNEEKGPSWLIPFLQNYLLEQRNECFETLLGVVTAELVHRSINTLKFVFSGLSYAFDAPSGICLPYMPAS